MAKEIKTFEERKKTLLEKGKQKGFITYEELADELRGLDVDSDSLDDLYNTLVDNHIEITSDENMEDEGEDDTSGEDFLDIEDLTLSKDNFFKLNKLDKFIPSAVPPYKFNSSIGILSKEILELAP